MRDGTIERRDGVHVLRYERHLPHPVERVWAALTEPAQLEQWLATAELELVEGGRIQLSWLNSDSVSRGTVTALRPPRLLEADTDVHGRLRWELEPDGDGTRLEFTCTLSASEEDLVKALAGWHIHLDHLADALDGRPVDWPHWWEEHGATWEAYHERYAPRVPA